MVYPTLSNLRRSSLFPQFLYLDQAQNHLFHGLLISLHHHTSPSQPSPSTIMNHRSSRFNSPIFNLHLSFPCHSPTLSTSISLPFSFCTTIVIPPLVFLPIGSAGSRNGNGEDNQNTSPFSARGVDEMKLEWGRRGIGMGEEQGRESKYLWKSNRWGRRSLMWIRRCGIDGEDMEITNVGGWGEG
ncbi:hypothetical protein L6452_38700 [Arctium lappa]|uniref:Uncharacterized protein n=1 Tax=Arctium lappa TaxID=4217 RepID=A0ACB8XR62_ARCLA|nr:hypothetical protein L6452_38700 [Arctium lappa]